MRERRLFEGWECKLWACRGALAYFDARTEVVGGGWGVRGVGAGVVCVCVRKENEIREESWERKMCCKDTEGERERGRACATVTTRNAKKKNNMRGRAEVGGEHERRAAGVGLNILSARFPTAERWINRSMRECVHDSIRLPHLLPRPPFSNQQQLVNAPAPQSSQRHSESLGELGEYTKSLAGWGGSWQTGSRLKGRLLEDRLSRL